MSVTRRRDTAQSLVYKGKSTAYEGFSPGQSLVEIPKCALGTSGLFGGVWSCFHGERDGVLLNSFQLDFKRISVQNNQCPKVLLRRFGEGKVFSVGCEPFLGSSCPCRQNIISCEAYLVWVAEVDFGFLNETR